MIDCRKKPDTDITDAMVTRYGVLSEDKHSLRQVSKKYQTTKLDGSFQRWGGIEHGSGWSIEDGILYIHNVLSGAVFNKIILASVPHCLDHARRINDKESIEYFEARDAEGSKYVSIDGNNSSSMIHAFLDNHQDLYFLEEDGKTKAYFDDFSEAEQESIQHDKTLTIAILGQITLAEMTALFRAMNKQTNLNNQEHRQARITYLSRFVRDLANHTKSSAPVKEIFTKLILFFGPAKVDRRVHEEMVAMLALKIQSNYTSDLSKNALDDFYEKIDALTPATEKRVKEVLLTCAVIAKSLPSPNGLSQKVTKNVVHNLWDMIDCVIGNNYKITDPFEFMNWYLSIHSTSWVASESVPSGDQEDLSYQYWTTYCARKTYYSKIRQLFNDKLMLTADALESAGIIKKKRTSQDRFTFDTKLKLWTLQGHRDRNDADIQAIDLYLGKTHADHVRSVQDGGATTLSNAELMFTVDNLKKGSNSNLPAFPHQEDFAFEEDEE